MKHITHNEALKMLDALVHLGVESRDVATPPVTPTEGDAYIVAASATDAWAGKDNQIAVLQDEAWQFYVPATGWLAYVADVTALLVWDGSAWELAGGEPINPAPLVGVNTTADVTNKLAVKSDAILFSHDDVTPGTGSVQHKLNKASAVDTSSVLFQTAFSGRAEFGLAGDDDWHVKVSPDGVAWHDALVADRNNGSVIFPGGLRHPATGFELAQSVFLDGGDGMTSIMRFDRARGHDPRTVTIGSVASDILNLTTADADLIFYPFMREVSLVRVWNISKATPEPAWVKYDPASGGTNDQLQVTDAADVAGWLPGEVVQLGDEPGWPGVPAGFIRGYAIDISPMLQNMMGVVFPQKGLTFKCALSGVTGRASLAATPNGVAGSFVGGNSLSDGGQNVTQHVVTTSVLSPISNSNLVWVRESQDAGGQIGIALINVVAVWV